LAGAGGLKFWQQDNHGAFTDVTAKTGLDAATLNGDYFGVWAADIEMDGDLDIVVAPRSGPPIVLRNNGDGTFKPVKMFPGVASVRAFVWAVLDNDAAPAAAFLDAKGQLHVFANDRAAQFHRRDVPKDLGRLVALAVADVNDDGVLDLIALHDNGTVSRISDRNRGQGWDVVPLIRTPLPDLGPDHPFVLRMLVGDLDNNGMPDLIVTQGNEGHIWLGEGPDRFTEISTRILGQLTGLESFSDRGRLDPVGMLPIARNLQPVRYVNRGTKDYHWQAVRPFATTGDVRGDNRINSFG